VKDTILGHPSKELLETKEWVTSEYGAPGVTITTPMVLQRMNIEIPEELKDKVQNATFQYLSVAANLKIEVRSTKFTLSPEQEEAFKKDEPISNDLLKTSESIITNFESQGGSNITVKRSQFITPNGQEGLKTEGQMDMVLPNASKALPTKYTLLHFRSNNIRQQVMLVWSGDDEYADQIIERMLFSIELLKLEEEDK
jgi:hypothetical protein